MLYLKLITKIYGPFCLIHCYAQRETSMNDIPKVMKGIQLTGHGGLDKLMFRNDIPVPTPGPRDVLIKVSAAGVNNTDLNT